MNVYNFDNTIFYPDCMTLFVKHCIKRDLKLLFKYIPELYKATRKKKDSSIAFHACLNGIIKYLPNPQEDIATFWEKYERNISAWYLLQKKDDDLVISVSPEYLIKPMMDKLNIRMIGTIVEKESGTMVGNLGLINDKAKFVKDLNLPVIDKYYSDSLVDTPIASLAKKAYLVTQNAQVLVPWPNRQ